MKELTDGNRGKGNKILPVVVTVIAAMNSQHPWLSDPAWIRQDYQNSVVENKVAQRGPTELMASDRFWGMEEESLFLNVFCQSTRILWAGPCHAHTETPCSSLCVVKRNVKAWEGLEGRRQTLTKVKMLTRCWKGNKNGWEWKQLECITYIYEISQN